MVEVITRFFEMLAEWLRIVPELTDYIPHMKKHPNLYLVCPEAAIVNLYKSFITTIEMIFGLSPRSSDFMGTCSLILNKSMTSVTVKSKKMFSVQGYLLESFVEAKCLKALTNFLKSVQSNPSADYSMVTGFLSEIAPTFTKVEINHEDATEFIQAVNSFLYEENSGICQKIRHLPPSQVKDLNEEEIVTVVKAYYDLSGDSMGKELYCAKVQLDLLLIFLQSPYIDKKLTALNEIKKMFDKRTKNKDVPGKILAKWLSECNVIEYIYKEAKHPELISRSAELINILASNERLEIGTLELIWETWLNEHKHEAVTEATLNVIASIARVLNSDMIEFMINQIHKLPLSMLGEYIKIVKSFYINVLHNFSKLHSEVKIKQELSSRIKLNILWEAIQDESELSNKNKLATLEVLIELMTTFDLSNTSEFLVKAIDNLKIGSSAVKWMILIEKILDSWQRRGYPTALKKEDLIQLAIQSADIYLNQARENSPMDGSKIEDTVFSGSLSHKQTIEKYFQFITYLLTKFEGHNKLNNEHIEAMFKVFVKESICEVERASFYKFFTYDEFDQANQDLKRVANARNREFLFQNILCKELNSVNTGPAEFKCFETNFFYINTSKKNLKRESNEQVFRTISMNLEGLDLVWEFSINSENHEIRTECNNFLSDLYLFYEKEHHKKRGQNNASFFDAWLEKILTIDESEKLAVSNILRLLFTFVKRYDGHHMDNQVFEKYETDLEVEMHDVIRDKKRSQTLKVNKDMTIGAIRKRIADLYGLIPSEVLIVSSKSYLSETCMNDRLSIYKDYKKINVRRRTREEREQELPRYLAAENLRLITQVIEKGLESDNHALRCESLQFFEYIPANSERRNKMIE